MRELYRFLLILHLLMYTRFFFDSGEMTFHPLYIHTALVSPRDHGNALDIEGPNDLMNANYRKIIIAVNVVLVRFPPWPWDIHSRISSLCHEIEWNGGAIFISAPLFLPRNPVHRSAFMSQVVPAWDQVRRVS